VHEHERKHEPFFRVEVRCGCGWMDEWMMVGLKEDGRHVEMARCEECDGSKRIG
jgi:hypothetical protein